MTPWLRRFRLGKRLVDRVIRVDEIAKVKNADIAGAITDAPMIVMDGC
jgi:hypothetical protein